MKQDVENIGQFLELSSTSSVDGDVMFVSKTTERNPSTEEDCGMQMEAFP